MHELFVEAKRQLDICNSCRYCAGYCPVWPALERRVDLKSGDITQMANLCHDCRDCFTACMYTAPHEFDLNPPKIFTQVREETYEKYVWPGKLPKWADGWTGVGITMVLAAVVAGLLSWFTGDRSVWFNATEGNPYDVVGHWTLVFTLIAPLLFSYTVLIAGLLKYWKDIHGSLGGLFNARAWGATLEQSATLSNMSGGDEGCAYEDNQPSINRKVAHHLVMWGFLLTFFATVAAAFNEYILGWYAPYPYLSVPVVSGTIGGIAATIGCIMLLVIKRRADRDQTTATMRSADYGLIWSLLALMITGLATTALRETVLFAPVFIIHLASILVAFLIFPYTKFVHFPYRILSIYQNALEVAEEKEKVHA